MRDLRAATRATLLLHCAIAVPHCDMPPGGTRRDFARRCHLLDLQPGPTCRCTATPLGLPDTVGPPTLIKKYGNRR
ncbi:MAG TPA: hypothetical protein VNM90_25540, partial [Haliangium sp.]|nr:hypothetical protein [Haliangium sp.]